MALSYESKRAWRPREARAAILAVASCNTVHHVGDRQMDHHDARHSLALLSIVTARQLYVTRRVAPPTSELEPDSLSTCVSHSICRIQSMGTFSASRLRVLRPHTIITFMLSSPCTRFTVPGECERPIANAPIEAATWRADTRDHSFAFPMPRA